MKKNILLFSLLIALNANAQTMQTFHGFNAVTILGDTISMSQYAGKKIMVVNTASYCAYTPQYTALQQLYAQYHAAYNFEIIGFPCNDFGNQEPGNDSTISNFCTNNYNVTFQMMHPISIVSNDTAPVYKWLQLQNLNGVADASVTWNFNKFLIDEAGHWVQHYVSQVLPNDAAIINWITTPNITQIKSELENDGIAINNFTNNQLILINKTQQLHNYKIFSVEGMLIETFSNNEPTFTYNTSKLSSGIYFILYSAKSGVAKTAKFVVE